MRLSDSIGFVEGLRNEPISTSIKRDLFRIRLYLEETSSLKEIKTMEEKESVGEYSFYRGNAGFIIHLIKLIKTDKDLEKRIFKEYKSIPEQKERYQIVYKSYLIYYYFIYKKIGLKPKSPRVRKILNEAKEWYEEWRKEYFNKKEYKQWKKEYFNPPEKGRI